MWENADQNNSEYGHFSRSVLFDTNFYWKILPNILNEIIWRRYLWCSSKTLTGIFFWNVYQCDVSSLTLSYLSLKVIAPLDKIVFYVERQFDKFVYSFEVNIFFRRWSFFASACFFNLLFSCAKLLHSFFTLRYLRVYFLCVVFPFWCQPCKFSGKVFKCFTSISFILVSFKFFSSVWSFAKRAANIDVKIKSDEAENIATFLCWLRDDVHIHLATLIGQQSRALLT